MHNINLSATLISGETVILEKVGNNKNVTEYTLPASVIKKSDSLTVSSDAFGAKENDTGYYLISGGTRTAGSILAYFKEREDGEILVKDPLISLFAVGKEDATYAVLIERRYAYTLRAFCENKRYGIEVEFDFSNQPTDEDICIRVIELAAGADYNDVARAVREYRLQKGEIRALKDKCTERPALEYVRKHPVIRIRMGWKPVPPDILHQTTENEPPMYMACDFERVCDIANELKRQGVEGAELCLVGWNQKGHDGRWPQIFPVEEAFGGEEELKRTIRHVQSLGYRITCHTNCLDNYEIANNYDESALLRQKNGTLLQKGKWSGGAAYLACPHSQLKRAREDLPRVADLGFAGVHYIDVLSIVMPQVCFSPEHPCNMSQAIEISKEIMTLSRELFGGFSSEGAYDFTLGELDFSLYNSFCAYDKPVGEKYAHMTDLQVPLWELIYHGIALYNPSSTTVNYTVKPSDEAVTLALYGGKPAFYFYSKFCTPKEDGTGANWMGETDITCNGKADLEMSVAAIKKAEDEYKTLADRQLVFMRSYYVCDNGLRVVTYEDGVRVVGNYTDMALDYDGVNVLPHSYRIID